MGKIVVSENVSLDGVIEDPAGDEGFTRGGWVGRLATREEIARLAIDEALGAEALLLGRASSIPRRSVTVSPSSPTSVRDA
jgi:hypothetical protein